MASNISSTTANTLYDSARRRRERDALTSNAEMGVLNAGGSFFSMVMTFVNMVVLGWLFFKIGDLSGMSSPFVVQQVDMLHVFMAATGLALGWLATGSLVKVIDADSGLARVIAIALAVAMLVASIGSSGFFNLSFFEAGKMRAETELKTGSSFETMERQSRMAFEGARRAYDSALEADAAARARVEKSQEAVIMAQQAFHDWQQETLSLGMTTAAANRRFSPEHPQRVAMEAAIAKAERSNEAAIAWLETQRAHLSARRLEFERAKDSLERAQERARDDAGQADVFVRTADTIAPMLGLRSGEHFLAGLCIFLAALCSLAPPVQTFLSRMGSRGAVKEAEAHREMSEALSMSQRIMQEAGIEQPKPAPPPVASPPPAAVEPVQERAPDPVHEAEHEPPDPPVNEYEDRRYAFQVNNAIRDAGCGELTKAGINHLKAMYKVNEDGAKAIRRALVRRGLAVMDGPRCELIGQ